MFNRPSLAEEAYFQALNAELRRRLARRDRPEDPRSGISEIASADAAQRETVSAKGS